MLMEKKYHKKPFYKIKKIKSEKHLNAKVKFVKTYLCQFVTLQFNGNLLQEFLLLFC